MKFIEGEVLSVTTWLNCITAFVTCKGQSGASTKELRASTTVSLLWSLSKKKLFYFISFFV